MSEPSTFNILASELLRLLDKEDELREQRIEIEKAIDKVRVVIKATAESLEKEVSPF